MKVDFSKIRDRYGENERVVFCQEWDGEVTLRRATSEERVEAAIALSQLEKDESGRPSNQREMLRAALPLVSQTIIDGDVRPFDSDVGREELRNHHMMAVIQLMSDVLEINMLGGHADEAIDESKNDLAAATNGS